jgi:uncharacterized protein YndB with AHSA1/START domain
MTVFPSVTIEREYDAPIERVFKAWTEPDQIRQWFHHAENSRVASAEAEASVGGKYRITVDNDDYTMVMFGAYTIVDPPKTLEFTFLWEESSMEKAETLVRVDLEPIGNRTRLKLTHSRLSSEESSQAHGQGWDGVLNSLSTYLS